MKIKLKFLHLENFKGTKNKTYQFGDLSRISGMNRLGKTTIATAWFWLLSDKNYELNSNPNIRPNDVEECIPTVTAVLDIGGKEVIISKMQKRKSGKPDSNGVSKVTLANTYTINEVPRTERDFRSYLEDLGLSFENFLVCSHPNVFTGQKTADMRKVLFKMASEKTDYDIAAMSDEAVDVAKLLADYKFEEIEAMKKAEKKKSTEQVDAIPNQIVGLEKAKVDIDVAELELGRNSLKEQIAENKAKQDDVSKQFEEYQKLSDGIMQLKFAESDLVRKANEELVSKKKELQLQIDEKNDYLLNISDGIQRNNREIAGYEFTIENQTKQKERLAELWKSVNVEVFDESTTICPTCHRELPIDEIESLRNAFAKSKADRLADIEKNGTECKHDIENANSMIPRLQECNKDNLANKEKLEKEVSELEKQLSELPESIEITDTEEYKAIHEQIVEKEQALSQMNNVDDVRKTLKAELDDLQSQLTEVEKQIALSENNVHIDEQISELREKQRDYEQAKADAEKILYQLSLVSKKKNELLVEEINNHFGIVKWLLFDYQKNGEYKEVCIPTIDGKRFGDSTNTGREIEAKLDICNSFQKFFGMQVPIFLDGAESINDEYLPKVDTQLILLTVTKDRELKVEVE